jgi:uncharacterized protein with von Willebrand factor type A (vWA) domain
MADRPLFGRAHLSENILHFARVLRKAGLPVGPAKVIAALEAVEARCRQAEDFSRRARVGAIERHEQQKLFDQAFDLLAQPATARAHAANCRRKSTAAFHPRGRGRRHRVSPKDGARRAAVDRGQEQEIDLDATLSFVARGAAEQGLRDHDRGASWRRSADDRSFPLAAAGIADAAHPASGAGRRSTCARRCAQWPRARRGRSARPAAPPVAPSSLLCCISRSDRYARMLFFSTPSPTTAIACTRLFGTRPPISPGI